jgi:hypothetical protein
LEEYKKLYGTVTITANAEEHKYRLLRRWTQLMRNELKNEQSYLMLSQRARLEGLGMVDMVQKSKPELEWQEEGFEQLKAFKQEHGHRAKIGSQSYRWAQKMRKKYQLHQQGETYTKRKNNTIANRQA